MSEYFLHAKPSSTTSETHKWRRDHVYQEILSYGYIMCNSSESGMFLFLDHKCSSNNNNNNLNIFCMRNLRQRRVKLINRDEIMFTKRFYLMVIPCVTRQNPGCFYS